MKKPATYQRNSALQTDPKGNVTCNPPGILFSISYDRLHEWRINIV